MKYASTRGQSPELSFSQAVSEGLAPDGGLFVPESLPDISQRLASWEGLDYPSLSFEFLKLFADDIPERDLRKIVFDSYKRFDTPEVAPLRKLGGGLYILELFHGPTLAFKDFALQLLGNLYEYLLKDSGRKINVLGATSGDTGSAAINGLLGKRNVNIFMLYPYGRISALQERQMTCTGAGNVFPIAVDGTFDDAQAVVKELFADVNFKSKWNLSAVNSINIARVLAQCVYYIYAFLKIPESEREDIEFVVPTGNFGNVLAGWLAGKCGLGVKKFRVATNRNDILCRLFNSGLYEVSQVRPSCAPSMDIQVASNFERFIWYLENGNAQKVRSIMAEFKAKGRYFFDNFNACGFSATSMDDSEIVETISEVWGKYKVVIDPHTACAFKNLDTSGTKILLSTAHPAKFPELIRKTLNIDAKSPILESLAEREIVRKRMGADASAVRSYIEENGIR